MLNMCHMSYERHACLVCILLLLVPAVNKGDAAGALDYSWP